MGNKFNYYNTITDTIGNTPLVRLNSIFNSNVNIFAKCEFLNPTGSVKDRIVGYIIDQAEKNNLISRGGTIIESTYGNTGLSLAIEAIVRGYKVILTVTDKMSKEKYDLLKATGVTLYTRDSNLSIKDPENYINLAIRLNKEIPNSYYLNQYHNLFNQDAHYNLTGPELYKQTNNGDLDYFVTGSGTGGTISGIAKYFKEKSARTKFIIADPKGSVNYQHFKKYKKITYDSFKVEGIGQDIICSNLDFNLIDGVIQVSDKESFQSSLEIVKNEGILAGGSTGTSVAAIKKILKTDKNAESIVFLACDSAARYISKQFNFYWNSNYRFDSCDIKLKTFSDLISRNLIKNKSINTDYDIKKIKEIFYKNNLHQATVVNDNNEVIGFCDLNNLVSYIDDESKLQVKNIDKKIFIDADTEIIKVESLLIKTKNIIIIDNKNKYIGEFNLNEYLMIKDIL